MDSKESLLSEWKEAFKSLAQWQSHRQGMVRRLGLLNVVVGWLPH